MPRSFHEKVNTFILCQSNHHRLRSGYVKCPDQEMAIVPCESDLSFLYKYVVGTLDSQTFSNGGPDVMLFRPLRRRLMLMFLVLFLFLILVSFSILKIQTWKIQHLHVDVMIPYEEITRNMAFLSMKLHICKLPWMKFLIYETM